MDKYKDESAILNENNNLMNIKSNFDYAIMDAELEDEEEAALSIYESELVIIDDFIFNNENELSNNPHFKSFLRSYNSKVFVKNEGSEESEGSYYTDPFSVEVHRFMSEYIQNLIDKNEKLLEKK